MPELSGSTYSELDASNSQPAPNGMPEGMPPSGVNDSWRASMGAIKRAYDRDHAGTWTTVGGTANAITLAYTTGPTAYVQGEKFAFKATAMNTGAVTVNVNGLGAINLFKRGSAGPIPMTGREIQSGDVVELEYDGTQFQLVSPRAGGSKSILTLSTLFSGFGPVAGGTYFLGTAGETISEIAVPTYMPFAATIRNMYCHSEVAAGAAQSYVYTARKNGADQSLTATISGTSATAASDTTNSFTVAAGDYITVKLVTSAGSTQSRHGVILEVEYLG